MDLQEAKQIIIQAQLMAYPNKEHAKMLGRLYGLVEEVESYRFAFPDLSRAQELGQADKAGRVVVLPEASKERNCALDESIGHINYVWCVTHNEYTRLVLDALIEMQTAYEAAEAALEGGKNNG